MKFYLIFITIFCIFFTSCSNQEFEIIIKNKGNYTIKLLNLYVQGKEFKVNQLEVNKQTKINIPFNTVPLNSHDFIIESKLILKNGKLNSGFYYSDLSGTPNPKYIIEVYDSHTVIK